MDKYREVFKTYIRMKTLFWLVFIAFLIFSFQTIMDIERIANPRHLESFNRILTALTHPNIFTYDQEELILEVPFYLPCPEAGAENPEQNADEPYLVMVRCGDAREIIEIEGYNFWPNAKGPINFIAAGTSEEIVSLTIGNITTDADGYFKGKIQLPTRLPVEDAQAIEVIVRLNIGEPYVSRMAIASWHAIIETIQIGFLATTISAVIALPFTFFSARPSSYWGRRFNVLLQPILSAIRSVHPLIIILPMVVLSGIGPTSAVLALILYSTAVLIVVFSEYAREHSSLNWSSLLKTHFPGLALKHLPVNILIATILGFGGGGGVGFLLQQNIGLFNYRDASVQILACIIAIGSLDLLGRGVWYKIIKVDGIT